MMKKLTKAALLAAATAFLLAGIPACSNDDDDTPSVEGSTDDEQDGSGGTGQDGSGGTGQDGSGGTGQDGGSGTGQDGGSGTGQDGGSGNESGISATAKKYSFTGEENGIVAADLEDWDLATKDVICSPIASTLTTKKLSNGASISWKGSKVGTLRFRAKHDANVGTIAELVSTITGLNYNGGADTDISEGISPDSLDRYVSIPVDGAGTVTASVEFKGAKTDDNPSGGPFQAAFVDEDGKLLGTLVTDEVTASSEKTVSGTVSAAGTVYLVFSRNGAKKGSSSTGGMDVSEIRVTPAE